MGATIIGAARHMWVLLIFLCRIMLFFIGLLVLPLAMVGVVISAAMANLSDRYNQTVSDPEPPPFVCTWPDCKCKHHEECIHPIEHERH